MQTLLLPGTDLRRDAARWGIVADALPPYGVHATNTMSEADVRDIEAYLFDRPDLPADPVTAKFCGQRLPDLFQEKLTVSLDRERRILHAPGRSNRRCLVIQGDDLYARREALLHLVKRCVEQEPDVLWQFVLSVAHEEPLDLFEQLVALLRSVPNGMLDRFASARAFGLLATRRVLVRLRRGHNYDKDWCETIEIYLAAHFM
jgi:hypothetical protein